MRYKLTDYEWMAVRPMLPNKVRGVPRVDDRRVLNGICWVLPRSAGLLCPRTTCYNRFVCRAAIHRQKVSGSQTRNIAAQGLTLSNFDPDQVSGKPALRSPSQKWSRCSESLKQFAHLCVPRMV
jgi:hypothetical protein